MKAKVIMLETTERADLRLSNKNKLSLEPHIQGTHYSGFSHTYQHLYLIDEKAEIKEGDWFMGKIKPHKAVGAKELDPDFGKIIATTDKSLKIKQCELCKEYQYGPELVGYKCICKFIPQLSDKSTKTLIEYYSKQGEMPDEIEIEQNYNSELKFEIHPGNVILGGFEGIKLNPQGTVDIIIPEEKTYKRDEVIILLHKAWIKGGLKYQGPLTEQGFTSFIQENLK